MPNASAGNVISSSAQINAGVIVGADLANDTITTTQIGTGGVGTDEIADGVITNSDISASAGIVDTKLATISTAGKVSGAALTSLSSTPAGAGVFPAANVPSAAVAQLTSPARSLGTNYQNTSGKNLIIYASIEVTRGSSATSGNHGTATAYMDTASTPTTIVCSCSSTQGTTGANNEDYQKQVITLMFFVPNNSYYRITATSAGTGGATIITWREQEL